MGQLLLVLVVALVVGGIVFGVAVLVTGTDRGLGEVEPDGRALPLPTDRPLLEGDLAGVRFDSALRGYRMAQVDQALRRAAYDIGYKDELISVLEAEVVALRAGRVEDAEVLRRAREAALVGSVAPGEEPAVEEPAVEEPAVEEPAEQQAAVPVAAAPDEPATGSGAAVAEPAELAAEPAELAAEPAELAAEPAELAAEPAEPAELFAEPGQAVAEPGDTRTGPGQPAGRATEEPGQSDAEQDTDADSDVDVRLAAEPATGGDARPAVVDARAGRA